MSTSVTLRDVLSVFYRYVGKFGWMMLPLLVSTSIIYVFAGLLGTVIALSV